MRRLMVLFILPALFSLSLEKAVGSAGNSVDYSTPQPRTVYHVEFDENGTLPEEPSFEVIPVGYLCEFCVSIIEMLKKMQKSDSNFEDTMRKDCLNHTEAGKKEICTYVNKVNLERLNEGSPTQICQEEKLCLGQENQETQSKKPEDHLPNSHETIAESSSQDEKAHSEKSGDKEVKTTQRPRFFTQFVTLNLVVEDIAR